MRLWCQFFAQFEAILYLWTAYLKLTENWHWRHMSRLNFVSIRSDPRTIFLSGNQPYGGNFCYPGRGKEKCLKLSKMEGYTLLKAIVVGCMERFIKQNVCKTMNKLNYRACSVQDKVGRVKTDMPWYDGRLNNFLNGGGGVWIFSGYTSMTCNNTVTN